jgi:cytochrome P450
VTASAVEFDPFSADFFNDPTETYRRMRDESPVYFSEKYGFYALTRFDDVVRAHRDWKAFSSAYGVDLSMLSKPDRGAIAVFRSIIMMDPPQHNRFRVLVSRVFTPRAIGALEPMVREVICSYLDALDGAPELDAVADFSAMFPVEIISRMLGVPAPDRQRIRHWLDISLHREAGSMDPTPEGMNAGIESGTYFYGLVGDKRKNPGDDMLSRLTQVVVDRGDGVQTGLDDAEIAGFATLLGGAGAETVTKLIGNAAVLFGQHPDQWEQVRDHSKIPQAVEEILRLFPPAQYVGRYSVEDSEFESGTISAGFPVLLVTGAATRDGRAYDKPDVFDIERPATNLAIGFGHGVHSCLGAALARMESRIAIEEMRKRWGRFEVDEAGLRRVSMSNVAGYSNVPIRLSS